MALVALSAGGGPQGGGVVSRPTPVVFAECTRPRASATAGIEWHKEARASCSTSATTDSVGRQLRREAMPTTWTSATPESARRLPTAVRTVFRCVASRNKEHPRASATRDREPEAGCMKSATAGTAGRRRFRRGVAMPATCSSTTAGSIRRIAATVRTVFRCVASRNKEHPRASATLWAIGVTADCGTSDTAGIAGHRRSRVPMFTT